jgi:hypothetical protein
MDYGKYIIVEVHGCELPILFDKIISHADFLKVFCKESIKAAGFFEVRADETEKEPYNIAVSVFGKSSTLKLDSREKDERLIKSVLRDRR